MIQSQINRNIRLVLPMPFCSAKLKKISHLPRLRRHRSGRSLCNRGFAGSAGAPADAARLVGAKLDLDEDAIHCCR